VLPPWWLLARDIGLFLLGAGLAVWEVVSHDAPRDTVLTFAGSLLGGPLALVGLQTLADAIRSRAGTGGPSSPSPAEGPPPSP
jgi:hypothetical protein